MHARSRSVGHTPMAAASLIVALLVAGCGDPGSRAGDAGPGSTTDEIAAHDGQVCPTQLPLEKNPGHGFGTARPAESAPSLPAPESAWVCQYSPTETGPGPDGNGTRFSWVRTGGASPVDSARLPGLEHGLTQLAPADDDRICTADLGPRWMLVYSRGTDLTGVVVDDYGCRDVRLTDEPFETVPGEATSGGTVVPGVLTGPTALLHDIKASAANN
jgi:hypothetical protein